MNISHFEKYESYIPLDLTTQAGFLSAIVVISAFILGRYFAFVFPFYFLFRKNSLTSSLRNGQVRLEIHASLISSLIFAFAGYLMGLEWQMGIAKIYLPLDQYGYAYLPGSFVLVSAIHEIYFYFTHRLMHIPFVYRHIHATHHFSRNTSPWASFSFHPGEALVQAAFLPLLICLLPLHPLILIAYLTFMTLTAISNHMGYELIPSRWILKWFISGGHHALHHKNFDCNYGLYFRVLDQLFGTDLEPTAKEKKT